jgi:hypothetical protein
MSTFVLVHGVWHEGSAWNEVIKQLEAKGHMAFAPTIAGSGVGIQECLTAWGYFGLYKCPVVTR